MSKSSKSAHGSGGRLVAFDTTKTFKCGNCPNTHTISTESISNKAHDGHSDSVGWQCNKCKSVNKIPKDAIVSNKIVSCSQVADKKKASTSASASKAKKTANSIVKVNIVK